ncbi:MAG: STAS domain-containing protein [Phycisphaeraceae bacterium]|nr:STAS domain-containing protein [Phycisphaeraceae bacterium]
MAKNKIVKPIIVNRPGSIGVIKLEDVMGAQRDDAEMRMKLRTIIEGTDTPRIILDMKGVQTISSLMLGAVMALNLRIRRQNGELRICNVTPDISVAFNLVRLSAIIPIDDTIDDAYEAFDA